MSEFTTTMGEALIDLVHQYPALWTSRMVCTKIDLNFPLVKNIDNLSSPPQVKNFDFNTYVGQLTKVIWPNAFLDKKKTFFVQH